MLAIRSNRSKIAKVLLSAAVAAGLLAAGGAAQAVLVGHSSGGSVSTTAATENTAWSLPAAGQGVWVPVPGMARSVTVPSGTSRQIIATYTAESLCQGPNWSYCSVRIVAINSAGTTELHPQGGTDFSFDAPGNNTGQEWESHARTQTRRLGAGSYRIVVQAARVGGPTTGPSATTVPSLRLDEQYFGVEVRG